MDERRPSLLALPTPSTRLYITLAVVAVLTVLCLARPAAAQEPALRMEIAGVSDADYPVIEAVVNVEDASGGGPEGLTADNFTATLDGKPAPVVAASLASSEEAPLDIVLILDTSGSMEGAPLDAAKAAAKTLVTGLGPRDRVAIMAFSDDVRLLEEYTQDKTRVQAAIDGLQAAGNTALYQATANAVSKANESVAQRRAVILLSDCCGSQDQIPAGGPSAEEALRIAGGVKVPVFAVAQGTNIDPGYLNQLAQATNGRFLQAPEPGQLGGIYTGLGRLLTSQYIVRIDAAAVTGGDPVPMALQVSAGGSETSAAGAYQPSRAHIEPMVTIDGLQDGDAVTKARPVTASVSGVPVLRVTFFVDGVNTHEAIAPPPFTFNYDPRNHGAGDHTLAVKVESIGVPPMERSIAFSSSPAAPGGGARLPVMPVVVAAGAVAGLLVVLFLFARLRPRRKDGVPVNQRIKPWAKIILPRGPRLAAEPEDAPGDDEAEPIGEPLGILVSVAGSDAGREYQVGGRAVRIGSGARCGVRIDDPDLAAEEARVWVRDRHLMLHRMTRMTVIADRGESGGWTILQVGDSFEVGAHRFEFRLLPAPQAAPAAGQGGRPTPLSQKRPKAARPPAPGLASAAGQAEPPRLSDMMPRENFEPKTPERDQQAS